MAGRAPTAAPSFMMIFLTRTTRPLLAGGSAAISSHLPRVTKHPCRVDIRGSPGASRMSPSLAPKRLNYKIITKFKRRDSVQHVRSGRLGGSQLRRGDTVKSDGTRRTLPVWLLFKTSAHFHQALLSII